MLVEGVEEKVGLEV